MRHGLTKQNLIHHAHLDVAAPRGSALWPAHPSESNSEEYSVPSSFFCISFSLANAWHTSLPVSQDL